MRGLRRRANRSVSDSWHLTCALPRPCLRPVPTPPSAPKLAPETGPSCENIVGPLVALLLASSTGHDWE